MKITTKLYLKSFFIYGLIFTLIMSLWEFIDNEKIILWRQVFLGSFFGAIMSWTMVTAKRRIINNKVNKNELTEDDFRVSQSELINKEIAIQEIYNYLKENEVTGKWKLKIKNSKIIGRTKESWSFWGEKIIITDLKNKIKVESKPILKTIMFDNGKNKKNIILIKELIEKL